MALLMHHKEDTLIWGIWQMNEPYEVLCDVLQDTTLVAQAEKRFASQHRRQEWLSVRLLMYRLLGEHKEIAYQSSGKPYLADGSYHISISHTKGYVAVILGNSPVGIDIEQYGERVCRISPKFMRDDELPVSYCGSNVWSLLLHWSAKEVMFKCMDTAEVDFKKHLCIFPFSPQEAGTFRAQEFKTARRYTFLVNYLLHSDFVMTWSVVTV